MRAALLAACDSGYADGPDPDALVGTWIAEGMRTQLLASVNRPQFLIDRERPGAGGITASGSTTGTLRHIFEARSYNEQHREIVLSSYDGSTPSDHWLRLTLAGSGYTSLERGPESHFYVYEAPAPPYTLDGNRLTLPAITLAENDRTVTLGGTLTFEGVAVEAGAEGPLRTHWLSADDTDEDEQRYVFLSDGTYRHEYQYGSNVNAVAGRWSVHGDTLRLSTTAYGITTAFDFAYAVEGGTLRISRSQEMCQDDPACLRGMEGMYLLDEGALTRLRTEYQTTLRRASAGT